VKEKRNEIQTHSFHEVGDMALQVRLNALAAILSFGFVIAVVLGMI